MPLCNTVQMTLPDGLVVKGENNIVKELASLLNIEINEADQIVNNVVNLNDNSPGSFGEWFTSQSIAGSNLNPALDENGIVSAEAVYDYIKSLEIRNNNETINIRFPNLILRQDVAEPILESFTIGYFNRLLTNPDTKYDFNELVRGQVRIPQDVFNAEVNFTIQRIKSWISKAQSEGNTNLVLQLNSLIENLNNNPAHFQLSFNRYLNTLYINASTLFATEAVSDTVSEETNTQDEIVDEAAVDKFEESDDLDIDEESDFVTKDNAQYNQKLQVNQRTAAKLSVYLMARTIPKMKIVLKDEVDTDGPFTKTDYKRPRLVLDTQSQLVKAEDPNKIMKILHNFLSDDIPNLDSLITKLDARINELYKNEETATDAKYLEIIKSRLDGYEDPNFLSNLIADLKKDKVKSFIDNKTTERALFRFMSRTEFLQQFTKMKNTFFHTVFQRSYNGPLVSYRVNNNKARLGVLAGERIQTQVVDSINRIGEQKVFKKIEELSDKSIPEVNKFQEFLDFLMIDIPNLNYYTTVDIDGKPVKDASSSALALISGKLFEPRNKKRKVIDTTKDLYVMFNYTGGLSIIGTQMRKFLKLVAEHSYYDFEVSITDYEGKKLYSIGLFHHLSLASSYINKFLKKNNTVASREALKEVTGDVAKFHEEAPSALLNQVIEEGNNISIGIESGVTRKNKYSEDSKTPTRKLGIQDRYIQTVEMLKNGLTPLIQSADRPVHMNIHVTDNTGEVVNTFDPDLANLRDRLIHAVRYELLVSRDYYANGVGQGLKHVDTHLKDFRLFQGLLSELGMTMEQLTELPLSVIVEGQMSTVFANNSNLNNKIDAFLTKLTNEWIQDLKGYFDKRGLTNELNNILLPDSDLGLTREEYFEVLVLNQVLNNFEQVRIFFGDLSVFKDSNEMFKRVATANSTKQIQRVDSEANALIDLTLDMDSFENYSISDNIDVAENPDTYEAWLEFAEDNIVNGNHISVVFTDPVSEISRDNTTFAEDMYDAFKSYLDNLGISNSAEQARSWVEAYGNNEHADSAGIISIDAYRRLKIRSGEWFPEHENLYTKILNKKPITKSDLQKAKFTPLKLQYSGYYKSGVHAENGFYANRKFAAFPAIPGVVPQNSALADVIETMQAHRIEFGFFGSSAKVVHGPAFDFYNFKNDFESRLYNPEQDMETLTDLLSAQFMGIQQNVNEQSKGKLTSSIQLTKNILTNLYEDGELRTNNKQLRQDIENYESSQTEIVRREAQKLIEELNIPEIQSYQDFFKHSFNSLLDVIKGAAKDRGYSRDVLNVIDKMRKPDGDYRGMRPVTYLEQLPIYDSVQYLLTAIFRTRVISKKRNGEGYVQAPAVGTEINKDAVNIEASLNQSYQFYRKAKDGRTWLPMQIGEPLPNDLIDYVADTYGSGQFTVEALDAFNEAIKKDEEQFINTNGKAYTDLTYIRRRIGYRIPHQSASSTEVIHVVKFTHPALNTQVIVPKELIKKNGSDYDVDKMNVYKPFYAVDKDGIKYFKRGDNNYYTQYSEREIFLGKTPMSEEEYIKSKKYYEYVPTNVLFNELLNSEINIAIHPENIAQLLAPLTESYLSNESGTGVVDRILALKQESDKPVGFNKALSPETQLKKFELFNGVKSNIGIAAVNIGYFPIFQKEQYVYIGDNVGAVGLLVQETTMPNARISLAKNTTVNGLLKSDVASQYANAYLDSAAKTGYPQLANMTGKNAGILFASLHLGGDPYRTLLILNQPIVDSYIREKQKQLSASSGKRLKNEQIMFQAVGPYLVGANAAEKYNDYTIPSNYKLTNKMLEDAIKDPKSPQGKEVQRVVLKLYIDLLELNSQLFAFGQANSADRSNIKDVESLRSSVQAENATPTRDNGKAVFVPSKFGDLGFLKELKKSKKSYYDSIAPLFLSNFPGINIAMAEAKQKLMDSSMKYNRKKLQRVFNSLNKQLFMYGISSEVLGTRGINYMKVIEETMKGNDSVARRIFNIQNNPDDALHGTPLINAFTPLINYKSRGYDVLKPDLGNIAPKDKEAIIKQHGELFNGTAREKKLAEDLVMLSIVQSGHESSVFNINAILNQESVFNIINPYAQHLIHDLKNNFGNTLDNIKYDFFKDYFLAFNAKYNFDLSVLSQSSSDGMMFFKDKKYNQETGDTILQTTYNVMYKLASEYFAIMYGAPLELVKKDTIASEAGIDSTDVQTNDVRDDIVSEYIRKCKTGK